MILLLHYWDEAFVIFHLHKLRNRKKNPQSAWYNLFYLSVQGLLKSSDLIPFFAFSLFSKSTALNNTEVAETVTKQQKELQNSRNLKRQIKKVSKTQLKQLNIGSRNSLLPWFLSLTNISCQSVSQTAPITSSPTL